MTDLRVDSLGIEIASQPIVRSASFSLKPGELVVLLGPNGAGKTMLLRGALGLQQRTSGTARLGGDDTASLDPVTRARRVSYLPQTRPLAWPNVVRDIVALGRFAYGTAPGRIGDQDEAAITRAIDACDIAHLATRRADTLSGGELARVHCARAFASETPLLIADEPVAALDPRHQFRVLNLFRDFVAQGGGALIVLHDIQLAARYADRLVWMTGGEVVADGPVTSTMTEERVAEIYNVRATVSGTKVSIEDAL